MNRTLLVVTLALLGAGVVSPACAASTAKPASAHAAARPYRVVFDLTSRDSLDQKAVVRWLDEISTANPTAQLEVVMYGKGFELVMPDRSTQLAPVREAAKNPRIQFRVCQVALRNNNVAADQLMPGVTLVPDGIREIVNKQQEGWGYIKVGH